MMWGVWVLRKSEFSYLFFFPSEYNGAVTFEEIIKVNEVLILVLYNFSDFLDHILRNPLDKFCSPFLFTPFFTGKKNW